MLDKLLTIDEGVKTTVYWDHLGYPTVGIGHLIIKEQTKDMAKILSALSSQVKRKLTTPVISMNEVNALFQSDLATLRAQIETNANVKAAWCKLDPVRKAALENMCFQLGVRGVAGFRKMLAALAVGNWAEAKKQGLDSTWAKQTPNRAKRVTDVLLTGTYKSYNL